MSSTKKPIAVDVRCDYCGKPATFHPNSSIVYAADYGPIWACLPCKAWVGCHPNDTPLGRLATKALRVAKVQAHAAFDPLWKGKMRRDGCSKGKARASGYKWLAAQLGIDPADCHIGMMDEAMCARVVAVCKDRPRSKESA
jgi:hypothetical protein